MKQNGTNEKRHDGGRKRLMRLSLAAVLTGLLSLLLACTQAEDDMLPQPAHAIPLGDSVYVSLRIAATATTRAAADKTDAENRIYDGILCIFEGADEATATLKVATAIDQHVLSSASTVIIQQLPASLYNGEYSATNHLYALLLLNTTSTGLKVKDDMLYAGDISLSEKKIEELKKIELTSVGSTAPGTGLFMSNKPTDTGSILQDITGKLHATREEAQKAGSSIGIPVECAAAKVTVQAEDGATVTIDSKEYSIHRFHWALANTIDRTYALRHADDATFRAKSPTDAQYSHPYTEEAFLAPFFLYPTPTHKSGDAVYCMENTSATNYTTVIIEVQLKDASSVLYTPEGYTEGRMYYKKTIKHQSQEGLVRNNYYTVSVTSLTGRGGVYSSDAVEL